MDLIKKKFEKKKKKSPSSTNLKVAAKAPKNVSKKKSKATKNNNKKKKASKDKKKKAKAKRNNSSSSSEESESDESDRKLKRVASVLAADAANIDKKYRLAGALIKKPENPPDHIRKILEAEWRDMTMDPTVTMDQLKTLDNYLRCRAELKSTDHVVISEKVDEDDTKSTTHLKILTKYDEGRFAAIYMVTNESAVDNNVVSVANGRFMMKTALRQLSSHQIVYRLQREINVLKMLWMKKDDAPTRIPAILHEGRMLGVPFYVTPVFDVNVEKVREDIGGGGFHPMSAYWIAQEALVTIKFIHRRQIVHRDIKPANLVSHWVNRDQWFLIDYGEAISVGKTSALSPPDGITLPFLSREAHDQLTASSPTTYQQDIESWFLLLVDLFKPLPWRDNNNIQAVGAEKKEFFKNPRLSDLPPQIAEIQKLLKTDPAPHYPGISKLMLTGYTKAKEQEKNWVPEWYDRAATRVARQAKAKQAKKTRSTEDDAQPTTNTSGENGTKTPLKKNQSMYCSVMEAPAVQTPVNGSRRKKSAECGGNGSPSTNTPCHNRQSVMMDVTPAVPSPASPATPAKTPDRSVYFNDLPAHVDTNKKKYKYKPKK